MDKVHTLMKSHHLQVIEQPVGVLNLEDILALAAVTNDPAILVANKKYAFVCPVGWLGLARLIWAWTQVLGLTESAPCPWDLVSYLGHAFGLVND